MGSGGSAPYAYSHRPLAGAEGSNLGYVQIKNAPRHQQIPRSRSFVPNHLIATPFNGIWSIYTSHQSRTPAPRIGQFSCSNEQFCYLGYGSHAGTAYTDLWRLDLTTFEWKEITLTGDVPSPRNGSRAVLVNGNTLVFFGGYADSSYFGDIYAVDLTSGSVTRLLTSGPAPSPRTGPLIGTLGNRIYLWGGYNGNWPNELHILDLETLTWRVKHKEVPGRTSVPFITYGTAILSYGGSKQEGMLVIDMEKEEVVIKETIGASPPTESMGAGMARVGRYALYYGGKTHNDKTLVYALDIDRKWWFVFHVLPDSQTVTLEDGHVTDNGLFMLPCLHSFVCAYSQARRQVVCLMGAPAPSSATFSVFSIGTALSIINHREDMKDMLKLC